MTVLLDGLPPGTRVSCPTAPWRLRQRSPLTGPAPTHLHVVSFTYPDRTIPMALCLRHVVLDHAPPPDPDAPRCPRCIARLTTHGLWPL